MTLVVVAVLAPVLAPYDPRALIGTSLEPPSGRHWLGTNDIGQDVFSQLVWGARATLTVALGGAALASLLAVLVGVGAGLLGGVADTIAVRSIELFLAVPVLPLLVLLAALAGANRVVIILVVGLLGWPPGARVLRSQTLSLRRRGFVQAARGFGGGPLYVVRRHLVPALGPVVVVGFVNWAAVASLLEAGLAFLGLGDPTGVSWGTVLNRALAFPAIYFGTAWAWWLVPAGVAITATVAGFTFLGVGLEPRLNPRLGGAAPR